MKFVNTRGLAFIGPGSEWFWTAASGAVLFVTFVAIYRQLRLQASALVRDEIHRISEQWFGERLCRQRLEVYQQLRAGGTFGIETPNAWRTCDFWDDIGGLCRVHKMDVRVIRTTMGPTVVSWWALMAPHIEGIRQGDAGYYVDFEWLAKEMDPEGRLLDQARRKAVEVTSSPEALDARIRSLEEAIQLHLVLRSPQGIEEPRRDGRSGARRSPSGTGARR